jgi:uncharacterized membrane protein YqgA involved in biofilm formation
MTGTLINTALVITGGFLGLFFGKFLSDRVRETIIIGLGLFTLGIGVKMFLDSSNSMIVLGGLLIGGLVGEYLRIESRIQSLGSWLETKFNSSNSNSSDNFVKGFLTSSILFCAGPMAILGAIQDGLLGDYQLLAIKSIMDGFAALVLTSTLGPGVIFSAGIVFLYQGSFSLLAFQLQGVMTEAMISELTATGGLLLAGIAFSSLLEIKTIRVGNFLPGLAISPLIVYLLSVLPF